MAHDQRLAGFSTADFLNEIHHLLWTPPLRAEGTPDGGYNCRDHAWVLAFLAATFGLNARIVRGQAIWACSRTSTAADVWDHSWVEVKSAGVFDLSVRLHEFPALAGWNLMCIANSACVPQGQFYHHEDKRSFERAMQQAADQPGFHAIYFAQYYLKVTQNVLLSPERIVISSPLIQTLHNSGIDERFYACVVLHLRDYLSGHASSLCVHPQREAWEKLVASRGDNAIYRLRKTLRQVGFAA